MQCEEKIVGRDSARSDILVDVPRNCIQRVEEEALGVQRCKLHRETLRATQSNNNE